MFGVVIVRLPEQTAAAGALFGATGQGPPVPEPAHPHPPSLAGREPKLRARRKGEKEGSRFLTVPPFYLHDTRGEPRPISDQLIHLGRPLGWPLGLFG